MRPLILAAFFLIIAPACAGNSLPDDFELSQQPGAILAAGKFGSLAKATCNGTPCQLLWLRNRDHSILKSMYNSIPKDGSEVGPRITTDGYFVGFITPGWLSALPPSQDKVSKTALKQIREKARKVSGVT